jgi:hypothetical protein
LRLDVCPQLLAPPEFFGEWNQGTAARQANRQIDFFVAGAATTSPGINIPANKSQTELSARRIQ